MYMFELEFYRVLPCKIYRFPSFIQSVNGEEREKRNKIKRLKAVFLSSYFIVLDLSPYKLIIFF